MPRGHSSIKSPSVLKTPAYVLIDVLLGSAIFVALIGFLVPAYLYGQDSIQLAGERQRAVNYAEEGLEAVRNIRDGSYASLVAGTYGLATSTGVWALTGTSTTNGEFTRQIIVGNGSTTDRKIATSTVTWNQNAQRNGSLSLVTYLDNWAKQSLPIAIVGSASTPADNAAQAGPTVAVTPPGGMVAGDVAVIVAAYRGTVTLTMSNAGGQTWTSLAQVAGTNMTERAFYAVYNGTWSANPSVTNTAGASGLAVVMHVFRNVDPSVVDVAQTSAAFVAPATPFDVTVNGITTLSSSDLVFAAYSSVTNNTWGLQTAGWSNVGLAQYRDTTGALSISTAYKLMPSAGTTGTVTNRQLTLGGTNGTWLIFALKRKP